MKSKKIEFKEDLFYILGALLGDGCFYYWKKKGNYMINLVGEREFTEKYAHKINLCLNKKVKGCFYKSKYLKIGCKVWFVNIVHKELFILFKDIKNDLNNLIILIEKENYKENSLQFIEGFFDAEGCIKIIREPVRKIPKICLDICNTDQRPLELIRRLLKEILNIEARYSIQNSYIGINGHKRKAQYHLRIYRKEYIKKFLDNISTIKLKAEKVHYVENWLKNKDKKEIITL